MGVARLDFDYDYDFLLFGISCHLKDYRLVWMLNKTLGIHLKKEEDIVVDDTPPAKSFSFYAWDDEGNRLKYILVANRGDSGYLVQEQKQADFFIVLEGIYSIIDKDELLSKIRSTEQVLMAFELNPNELKSRQNLLFD